MKESLVAAFLLVCLLSPMNTKAGPLPKVNVQGNIGGGMKSRDYFRNIDENGVNRDNSSETALNTGYTINVGGNVGGGAQNRDYYANLNKTLITAVVGGKRKGGKINVLGTIGGRGDNGDNAQMPIPGGNVMSNIGGGSNSRDSYGVPINIPKPGSHPGNIGGGSNSRDSYGVPINIPKPGLHPGNIGGGSNSRDSYVANKEGNVGGADNIGADYRNQNKPLVTALGNGNGGTFTGNIGGTANSRDYYRNIGPDVGPGK